MKVVYILFLVGVFVSVVQVILGLFINPFFLNQSRSLLKDTSNTQINSLLKTNDFSDAFKGATFYIEKKNASGELINVFIKLL